MGIEPELPGLFGSVRRVLSTVLALVESRIELIAVELREGLAEERFAAHLRCHGLVDSDEPC